MKGGILRDKVPGMAQYRIWIDGASEPTNQNTKRNGKAGALIQNRLTTGRHGCRSDGFSFVSERTELEKAFRVRGIEQAAI